MLGALNSVPTPKPTPYRHIFYPSPVVSKNKIALSKAKSLMDRLFLQIDSYSVPGSGNPVKVTPSANYDRKTESRAMPFYFKNAPAIVPKWNYERTKQGTDKQILGYRAADYAQSNDMVINPLNYSIDGNDFFRIEGHIGKNHKEAMSQVDNLRKQFNLPFDLVAIRLGEAKLQDIDLDDYSCQFDDLEAVLRAWQAEQNCLYGSISKFFSTFNTITGTKSRRTAALDSLLETGTKGIVTETAPEIRKEKLVFGTISKMTSRETMAMKSRISATESVDKNLFVEQDSIGQFFETILKEGLAMSIADFADEAKKKIDTTKLSTDDVEVVVNIPIRIIAGTRKLSEWMPDRLTEIDADMIKQYKTNLDTLCSQVKTAQTKIRSVFTKAGYVPKGYEQDYEMILWQLSENCCAAETLEVFQEEIQIRKENILKQLTFSNYLSNHPGLEHKAGVPAGGTFVMVYASTSTQGRPEIMTVKELSSDKTFVQGFATDDEMVKYVGMRIEENDVTNALMAYQALTGKEYNAYQLRLNQRKIEAYIDARMAGAFDDEVQTFSSNIVLADFCLPYICCSDCPPIAFIMPQPKVSLTLAKAVACSNDPLIPFRADPADGVVKASEGFAATVKKRDDGFYFDPSRVTDGQFGKPITFTLNDQLTDCTISIIKHPEITPSSDQKQNATELKVVLNAASNQVASDNFVYTWALGDGRVQSNLVSPKFDVMYLIADLRKNYPDGKLSLTLTVTNQSCTNTQPLIISFELPVEQPELKLSRDSVCSDAGAVPFTIVKPEKGIVESKTGGDRVNLVNGQWIYDPTTGPFNDKINDFTINGQPVPDCVLSIFEHPKPSFTAKITREKDNSVVIVEFENTTPNVDSFSFGWDLNGEDKSEEVSPRQIYEMTKFPRGRQIRVRMIATNKLNPECRATTETQLVALPGPIQKTRGIDFLDLDVRIKDKIVADEKLVEENKKDLEIKKVDEIKLRVADEKVIPKDVIKAKVIRKKATGRGTIDPDSEPK